MISVWEFLLIATIGFVILYALIDRICKCVEHKYLYLAAHAYFKKDGREDDVQKEIIEKFKEISNASWRSKS